MLYINWYRNVLVMDLFYNMVGDNIKKLKKEKKANKKKYTGILLKGTISINRNGYGFLYPMIKILKIFLSNLKN